MKFNWGYKIVLVYVLFVIGIMFLAYKSNQQKFELVQKDYYADELKFQNVINASEKAFKLGGAIKTTIKDGHLFVNLPEGFKNEKVNVNAHLYYAADESRDIFKKVITNNGLFEMELSTKMSGAYTLKLDIVMHGDQYYYEQKIMF
jgi:hypothetical protein